MKEGDAIWIFSFVFIIGIIVVSSLVSANIWTWLKDPFTGRATQSVTINITVVDPTPPTIDRVMNETILISPVENATYKLIVNFTASDLGGSGLNWSSAKVNISKTGEVTRYNNSCNQYGAGGTVDTANFTCTIEFWYFDINGAWRIQAFVKDNASNSIVNFSSNVSASQLSAFVVGPASLGFVSITAGSVNTTANTPWLLNNTGNKDYTVGNIKVNATNLVGETNSAFALYAANFSVGNNSGAVQTCEGTNSNGDGATNMSRSIFTAIVNSNLTRGNNSGNNNFTAQEQIFTCLNIVGSELSQQSYSTANQGSWTIQAV